MLKKFHLKLICCTKINQEHKKEIEKEKKWEILKHRQMVQVNSKKFHLEVERETH